MKPSPAVLQSLSALLLPTAEQTDLLGACLLSGDACRDAWQRWLNAGGDHITRLSSERTGTRRLLTILHNNLQRNQVEVRADLQTVLRTAAVREELRMEAYRSILRTVQATLAAASVEAVLLKGGALSATAYATWSLRHTHDIDLLVAPADQPRARAALIGAGFLPDGAGEQDHRGDVAVRHESSMPVFLHTHLFRVPAFEPQPGLARGAATAASRDPAMPVLAPAEMLVHVLGHAASAGNRGTLQWACDAVTLLDSAPAIDWKRFEEFARSCCLALPLLVQLRYLASQLQAAVPGSVLEALERQAATAGQANEDAFAAAFATSSRSPLELLRTMHGTEAQIAALRWIVLPSPAYLAWTKPIRSEWLLPFYYVERPISFLTARLRAAALRAHGGSGGS